jgi:hypothetical protein
VAAAAVVIRVNGDEGIEDDERGGGGRSG